AVPRQPEKGLHFDLQPVQPRVLRFGRRRRRLHDGRGPPEIGGARQREQREEERDHPTTRTASSACAQRNQAAKRRSGSRRSTWRAGTPPARASASSSGWLVGRNGALRITEAGTSTVGGNSADGTITAARSGSMQAERSAAASMRGPRLAIPNLVASVA